jgi:bifunctional UDP-N-acetylglucosamine pyrophosphorylase/glucosamine-1-phosphate N-acetyltransferase
MTDLACIILAAGKGTRMKSAMPKVMHELAGRPMIHWLLERVVHIGIKRIVIVAGPDMPDLENAVTGQAEIVIQRERNGTADAVKAALPALEGFQGRALILMGDEPLVPEESLRELAQAAAPLAVMGIIPDDPTGLGRLIIGDDGHLQRIVEEKDASDEERELMLCNGGNYSAVMTLLRECLPKISNDNAQGEYYLTDLVDVARAEKLACEVIEIGADHVWGVNSRAQLAEHERAIQQMLREKHMMNGVSLIDPGTVHFSWDTVIGPDTIIGPNVFFGRAVTIGEGARIEAFCHIEGAIIENGASIGPFARIRPKSRIGEKASVGNFTEVNRSELRAGSKAKHVSYLGDAVIGEKTNIGAGTVIANYDGYEKNATTIGSGAFIGTNATLVAPLEIGDGALVAAGSVVTKNVPADALAVARNRPIIRDGWAGKRRAEKGGGDKV